MSPGKRYTVFAIRTNKQGETIWTRAGVAFVNRDDSMNLYLDVLPMEGKLHVREVPKEKGDRTVGMANEEAIRVELLGDESKRDVERAENAASAKGGSTKKL